MLLPAGLWLRMSLRPSVAAPTALAVIAGVALAVGIALLIRASLISATNREAAQRAALGYSSDSSR